LTPWIIHRLTGRYPTFTFPDDHARHYFVTGSVIALAGAGSVVWGAGILSQRDAVSPLASLRAVRGPLTRARATACGARCPEVFGDPAVLLPLLYQPRSGPARGIGIAPHFSDWPRLTGSRWQSRDVRLIDMQTPIESVIDQIVGCELVASSSLHGLIASHAYGVPAVWIKFRDLPSGDDSKFQDYFLSAGQDTREPLAVAGDELDLSSVWQRAQPPLRLDPTPLLAACPFAELM
jgi:pyruvyltransferase